MEARFFQIQPQISFIAIIILLLLQAYNDSLQFVDCSFEEFIREKEPLQPVAMTATDPTSYHLYGPVDPMQTVAGMYYAPAMATSQAGSYPVFPVPSYEQAGYFGSTTLPITTAIPYTSEGFISSTAYSIPFAAPFTPVSSSFLQSQTEEISQMLSNVTFSSPPTSPQVTDDNQQPITCVDVTKDTVSDCQ